MPIQNSTNNRVLSPNARAVDVARATIQAVVPMQQRKADAAFQVNGYSGILYSILEYGTPCACKAKQRAIFSRLDQEGKASPGDINQMLNPNNNFGVRPYAESRLPTRAGDAKNREGYSFLEVNVGFKSPPPVPLASLFDESDLDTAERSRTGLPRVASADSEEASRANVLVDADPANEASNLVTDFDTGLFGMSDVSCPICFGSGFVGGYSPNGGYRKVLSFQEPSCQLGLGALIETQKEIPSVVASQATWTVLLPAGCVGVDALRVWNIDTQVIPYSISVDGITLTKEDQILLYCDGAQHSLEVRFVQDTEFTHLELQLNQSELEANFELPRLSKSSNQSLRERTDPFTINLSPRVPFVKSLDLIVESTFGKVLQVKTVTGLNDKRNSTLAWDVEVRPTQPQELFNLLPRRRPLATVNKPSIVRDNPSVGNYTRT